MPTALPDNRLEAVASQRKTMSATMPPSIPSPPTRSNGGHGRPSMASYSGVDGQPDTEQQNHAREEEETCRLEHRSSPVTLPPPTTTIGSYIGDSSRSGGLHVRRTSPVMMVGGHTMSNTHCIGAEPDRTPASYFSNVPIVHHQHMVHSSSRHHPQLRQQHDATSTGNSNSGCNCRKSR